MKRGSITFALFGNSFQEKKSAYIDLLLAILKAKGARILISQDYYQYLSKNIGIQHPIDGTFESNQFEADIVLSIGGDGTFLHAASSPPLMAPYFSIASSPYSEHVGMYGHFVLFNGEMYFL